MKTHTALRNTCASSKEPVEKQLARMVNAHFSLLSVCTSVYSFGKVGNNFVALYPVYDSIIKDGCPQLKVRRFRCKT